MKRVDVGRFLVNDPRVCHGQLTFKGTRVPVETVLYWLGKGKSIESVLEDWPYLRREAIEEAIQLAAAALKDRYAVGGENHESDRTRRASRRRRNHRSAAKAV